MIPIIFCSKGRAGQSKIMQEANDKQTGAIIAVEPKEADLYRRAYPNLEILQLPENDRGLSYSRNAVRVFAIDSGFDWYWNLDDDVSLYEKKGRKIAATGIESLRTAEPYFLNSPAVGQAGLEYSQFAWSAKKDYSLGRYCDCVVANRVEAFKGVFFDEQLPLKIDRDATLQVLSSGWQTITINRFCFSGPKNGSNKGGLHEVYHEGKELKASMRMVEKWSKEICQFHTKKDGRPDVKINWRYFRR